MLEKRQKSAVTCLFTLTVELVYEKVLSLEKVVPLLLSSSGSGAGGGGGWETILIREDSGGKVQWLILCLHF